MVSPVSRRICIGHSFLALSSLLGRAASWSQEEDHTELAAHATGANLHVDRAAHRFLVTGGRGGIFALLDELGNETLMLTRAGENSKITHIYWS